MQRAQVRARVRLRVGQRKGLGMISCVEHATLHFCSDAATARVANTPMQPPRASHRLCEAYCQRPAGRSCPAAHAAFHDFFSAASPAPGVGAQVELSARAAAPCEAGTPRAGCRARRRLVSAGQHGAVLLVRGRIMHLCTPARKMLYWVVPETAVSSRTTTEERCGLQTVGTLMRCRTCPTTRRAPR